MNPVPASHRGLRVLRFRVRRLGCRSPGRLVLACGKRCGDGKGALWKLNDMKSNIVHRTGGFSLAVLATIIILPISTLRAAPLQLQAGTNGMNLIVGSLSQTGALFLQTAADSSVPLDQRHPPIPNQHTHDQCFTASGSPTWRPSRPGFLFRPLLPGTIGGRLRGPGELHTSA